MAFAVRRALGEGLEYPFHIVVWNARAAVAHGDGSVRLDAHFQPIAGLAERQGVVQQIAERHLDQPLIAAQHQRIDLRRKLHVHALAHCQRRVFNDDFPRRDHQVHVVRQLVLVADAHQAQQLIDEGGHAAQIFAQRFFHVAFGEFLEPGAQNRHGRAQLVRRRGQKQLLLFARVVQTADHFVHRVDQRHDFARQALLRQHVPAAGGGERRSRAGERAQRSQCQQQHQNTDEGHARADNQQILARPPEHGRSKSVEQTEFNGVFDSRNLHIRRFAVDEAKMDVRPHAPFVQRRLPRNAVVRLRRQRGLGRQNMPPLRRVAKLHLRVAAATVVTETRIDHRDFPQGGRVLLLAAATVGLGVQRVVYRYFRDARGERERVPLHVRANPDQREPAERQRQEDDGEQRHAHDQRTAEQCKTAGAHEASSSSAIARSK